MGNKTSGQHHLRFPSSLHSEDDHVLEKFKKLNTQDPSYENTAQQQLQDVNVSFSKPKRTNFHRERPFDPNSVEYKLLESIIQTLPEYQELKDRPSDQLEYMQKKILLIQTIHNHVVGSEAVFRTPFANNRYLPITYCDYIASGKPLKFIEDYIFEEVLPTYANTHTTTSFTGYQTTHFREDARQIVAQCVGAHVVSSMHITSSEDEQAIKCECAASCPPHEDVASSSQHQLPSEDLDVVLFEGSGSTSAIATLVHCIGIREKVLKAQNEDELPVVFISPYEHHSNILPWRESGALVIQIIEDKYGNVDLGHLEYCLKKFSTSNATTNVSRQRMIIGSFSAASNVTGVISDCDSICKLCHEYGAVCFFDFAASAPYVPIQMNPTNDPLYHKDAIFISPHKFIGGPGTPGVLVAKKKLFQNSKYCEVERNIASLSCIYQHLEIPSRPGGGTVYFVDMTNHSYTNVIEEREEGGTPDIVGSIRCALAFKLKEEVGPTLISKIEENYRDRAFTFLSNNPNLYILGPSKQCIEEGGVHKLAFFSFLIRHGELFLHHSFVSLLLNDLFGLQVRGGCACGKLVNVVKLIMVILFIIKQILLQLGLMVKNC